MQTPDRPERPERPEWLDAWEAIDGDAVQALADALAGDGVDEVAARDALYALSGEWELVRVASPVEGSGGHEPFQSTPARQEPDLLAALGRSIEVARARRNR